MAVKTPPWKEIHEGKLSHITVSKGTSGHFAVLVQWNTDHGGFWEPWDTGFGRYQTKAEAIVEATQWADADEIPLYIGE